MVGQDLCIGTMRKYFASSMMVVMFFSLEESGQTALGPALLLSISMAARIPGSKVKVNSISN